MATAKFGRVITAMITPFLEDGSVDYEGAAALAKHLVAHGSEGILVGGTTGEGATMTTEEKLKLYKTIVDAVGRNAPGKRFLLWEISALSAQGIPSFSAGKQRKRASTALLPLFLSM